MPYWVYASGLGKHSTRISNVAYTENLYDAIKIENDFKRGNIDGIKTLSVAAKTFTHKINEDNYRVIESNGVKDIVPKLKDVITC
jgi:hypothetical protein